jgi:hypothetical protein
MRDREGEGLSHHDQDTQVDYRPSGFPSVGGDAPSRPTLATYELPPLPDEPVVVTSEPVPTPVGGGGKWRWVAAAVATLAVVAVVAGFFLFLGPRAGTPSLVAQYAPSDAAVYGEIRLDLPGDQRDRLVEFMSKFPGFADPASFQQKLDDTLEQMFVTTNTGLSWKNDIDPWFGGQLAVYTPSLTPAIGTPPAVTFVFSVEDRARLDALIQERLGNAGLQQEDYKGTVVWSGAPGGGESRRVSFAITADALVVATRNEDLKRALDIKSGEIDGLAKDAFFTQQLAALHTDRLGAFYYDYSSVFDAMPPPGAGIPTACLEDIRAAADIKLLGELRAEGDHMALTLRSQIPTGGNLPPAAANRRSPVLEQMPAGALAYFEMRQLGALVDAGIRQVLECLPTGPGAQFDPRQIEQALGVSLTDYFDFLGDAGIALTFADGKVGGGIIATVDDNAVATTRVDRVLSVIRLMGAGGGSGVTVEERDHNGVTLTVITFQPGLVQPTPPPSVAIAVANNKLYLGLDDFVVDALNRPAADSLASSTRLQAALAEAGAENAGIVYVDIAGLRALGESFLPAADRQRYDAEIKPFVEPLNHFVVVNRTDGGVTESDVFLYVE